MIRKFLLLLLLPICSCLANDVWPSDRLLRTLTYCSYGDAFGVGIEFWSRERILAAWDELDQGLVYDRSPPYDIGLQPGWYSDDTEQSLGLSLALHENSALDPRRVFKAFMRALDDFAREVGEPRGGYGSLRHISCLPDEERLPALEASWEQGSFRDGVPGNGGLMCALPLLLDYRSHYPKCPSLLLNNIVAQSFGANKNHYTAILATAVYLDAVDALWEQHIEFKEVIQHAIDFLTDRRLTHVLPSTTTIEQQTSEKAALWDLPCYGDYPVTSFIDNLRLVDSVPGPTDERASQLDPYLDIVIGETPPFLNEGRGLSCRADNTLFAILYALKWSRHVFQMAREQGPSGQFHSLLKFYVCFGGDVDTLAACCAPVAFLRIQESDGVTPELPASLSDQFIEAHLIEERLQRLL